MCHLKWIFYYLLFEKIELLIINLINLAKAEKEYRQVNF